MATNILFTRKTILASLLAVGIAGSAQAQAPSTLDLAGHAPGQAVGNLVGGGGATITGGGDNLLITYDARGAGGGASYEQPGRTATFAGSDGGKPFFTYTYAAPADTNPGREAWMSGGGDNTEVVYTSPYPRR
jgi:hypothetical protein